jgi:uncharacterized protein (DUF983 family)
MTACANHVEAPGVARCMKCRTPFCDACIAYLINLDPWCEVCANDEIDSGKGNPAIAIVVLVLGLVGFAALMYWQLYIVRRFWFYSAALVIVPFTAAWGIAYPPWAAKPTVARRERGLPPIPPAKRRL